MFRPILAIFGGGTVHCRGHRSLYIAGCSYV